MCAKQTKFEDFAVEVLKCTVQLANNFEILFVKMTTRECECGAGAMTEYNTDSAVMRLELTTSRLGAKHVTKCHENLLKLFHDTSTMCS